MNSLIRKSLICTAALAASYVAILLIPDYFGYIIGATAILIVLLWKFFFDVDLNKSMVFDKSKFLILPMIFNLGALYLTTIFFQDFAKVLISFLAVIGNYYLWVSLRKVHNLSERAALINRNTLVVISFISVFLGSSAAFRFYMLLSTTGSLVLVQAGLILTIFLIFYLVSSFLTWENSANTDPGKLRPYAFVCSLLGTEVAWASCMWIVNYPVISVQEKANLGGTPLPAILLTIIFYFLWGILFHKLDNSLTKKVLTEYIFIATLFITVLLITAKWLPAA